jgi:hypothetical protein
MVIKIHGFEWDKHNTWKPLRHGVEIDEVESVFYNQPIKFLNTHSERQIALGHTDDGRYLAVVFQIKSGGIIRPITARDMTDSEREYFKRRR